MLTCKQFPTNAAAVRRSHSRNSLPRALIKTRFQQGDQVDLYSNGVFDFKQSHRVKIGDTVPLDSELLVLEEGSNDPKTVKVQDIVKGKKVVFFGLPGAYTSICSSKHVPNYLERYEELRSNGLDVIACLSVNDPWVMREWAKNLQVDPSKILMLADGEGLFHSKLGLLQHMPGLGIRAIRYSLLLDDGKVAVLNVEEPGGKSYKVSGPAHMLDDIANLKGKKNQS